MPVLYIPGNTVNIYSRISLLYQPLQAFSGQLIVGLEYLNNYMFISRMVWVLFHRHQ